MVLYRILLGIDALALGIALLFFAWGLSDSSVSSFNILEWILLLGTLGGILAGGLVLQRQGSEGLAKAVLALLAVPAALFGLFFLLLILASPRWN